MSITYERYLHKNRKWLFGSFLLPFLLVLIYHFVQQSYQEDQYEAKVGFYLSNHHFIEGREVYDEEVIDININLHELEEMALTTVSNDAFGYFIDSLGLKRRLGVEDDVDLDDLRILFNENFMYHTTGYYYVDMRMRGHETDSLIWFLREVSNYAFQQYVDNLIEIKSRRLKKAKEELWIHEKKYLQGLEELRDQKGVNAAFLASIVNAGHSELNEVQTLLKTKEKGFPVDNPLLKGMDELDVLTYDERVHLFVLVDKVLEEKRLMSSFRDVRMGLEISLEFLRFANPIYKIDEIRQLPRYQFLWVVISAIRVAASCLAIYIVLAYILVKFKVFGSMYDEED